MRPLGTRPLPWISARAVASSSAPTTRIIQRPRTGILTGQGSLGSSYWRLRVDALTSGHGFQPDWASAPGETMTDILDKLDLPVADFARQIGQTLEGAADLLHGRATITISVARQLEKVLGASMEFWMSRDFQYREDVARLNVAHQDWLNELPVGDMIKFGWLTPIPHPAEEAIACLRFFGVPDVQTWREKYAELETMVAFRTSPSFDSRPASVAAWIRQGEIRAGATNCGPWDAQQFADSLPAIRALTQKKDPGLFIPELRRHCAESGVALTVVRAPNGCRASGATRFLSPGKAMLLLSFRYLTNDHFWFTFFHEAGHLLLHDHGAVCLEGNDLPSVYEEQEANDFAAKVLVPPEDAQTLRVLKVSQRDIVRFATRIGVSPGIVVGQLQHLDRIGHHQMNRLKRHYRWEEIESINRGMG